MPKAETCEMISQPSKDSSYINTELVEQMTKRIVLYLDSFDNSASAIRGKDEQEIVDAYHEVLQKGDTLLPPGAPHRKLSDSELKGLEQSLQAPASTVYDHVSILLAAHTLLLSHSDEIGKLSPELANQIHARTAELRSIKSRSQSKPASCAEPSSRSLFSFVPPPPLPKLMRPTSPTLSPVDNSQVQQMLASPPTLVGKLFFLEDADIYYRVAAIELSFNKPPIFRIQYEDDETYAEDISEAEMKNMLIDSSMVHLV